MVAFAQGTTAVTTAWYETGVGGLVDPVLPLVSILDPANVAQVTNATPVRVSTGIYTYSYALSSTAALGIWRGVWTGSISGQPVGPIDDYFEVKPYGFILPSPGMAYSYDPTTAIGKLRLYIDDRDLSRVNSEVPLEQRSAIFTDQELRVFLDNNNQSVLRSAAEALTVIAGNRQLLVMSRRIGQTTIDYGSVRADLLKQADALRAMDSDQFAPADGIVEQSWTDFGERRIITESALRNTLP